MQGFSQLTAEPGTARASLRHPRAERGDTPVYLAATLRVRASEIAARLDALRELPGYVMRFIVCHKDGGWQCTLKHVAKRP